MKKSAKKKLICGVVATALTVTATMSGCSLVSTDSFKDLDQVVLSVNVSKAENFDSELLYYKSAVNSSTEIKKRDLVSYFVNVGYTYVSNYGMSYSDTFNMLIESLSENAIMTQYATMYLLNEKAKEEGNTDAAKQSVLDTFNSKATQSDKYEYLLGADSDDVKIAKYSLMSSINSAIDSYETSNIKSETSTAGSETRSTPGNVDTENEDYYPDDGNNGIDYNIYTGYAGYMLSESGTYKDDRTELLKKNSTQAKRITAYNDFISGLASYNLVDKKSENLRDVLGLAYVQEEYVAQLEQRIINKYYDYYEDEQEKKLNDDEKYDYVKYVYNELLEYQEKSYESEDDFASSLSSLSDSSFLLYSPSTENGGTYGYVYNILLPFSEAQSAKLTQLQSDYADEDGGYLPEYYTYRNQLLKNITTIDQRTAWFNGATEYAFKATDVEHYGASDWLFFENNMTNSDRYESLDKYAGTYAYNGLVVEKTDDRDDYVLLPNTLGIDDMVEEFCNYINYVLDGTQSSVTKPSPNANYYKTYTEDNLYSDVKDKEIDYSNFLYTAGKVSFGGTATELYNRTHVLDKNSDQYKALSAVNELQYAYTTDTGVLSQYLGYSVEAGDTSYIKEFEYAAHEAVKGGAGSFNVCAGDYGWHLIYVTYTFDANDMAQFEPDWENNIKIEGTFENLFYEWIKSTSISDISTKRRSEVVETYSSDKTVVKYVSRYQDLLDMDNA